METYFILLLFVGFAAGNSGSLIYSEEFDGTSLNTNDWLIDVWPQAHNNELQYYTARADNIKVQDGKLVITPLREDYGGKMWTSGRVNSNFAWKYGRVEVRAKLPIGYGLWPAIWMMPKYSVYGGWPLSGEIDICEARGEHPDEIQSTIHFGELPYHHQYENSGDLKIGCSIGGYHVYTLDWTPTALIYSLDGEPYFSQDLDRIIAAQYSSNGQPFDQYFHLILNTAVGGHYVNDPSPSTTWNYPDAEMWVDYVRVYDLDYIADQVCVPKEESTYTEVCDGVQWACGGENVYADVSAECTPTLLSCCSTQNCELQAVKDMAANVFTSYDQQVNGDTSCDFGGAAERDYVLKNQQSTVKTRCLVKDSAHPYDICGSMQWACSSENTYADVSSECNAGSDVLACCYVDPYSCDETRLREAAGAVFDAYYQQIPVGSSCDFGGVAYLSGVQQPLQCQDGYGL